MDAFFASIEERDNPRLRGRPIAVGSDPKGGAGRGVVSTANYPARSYGIRSALPISVAWRLSEEAKRKGLPPVSFLEVNMRKYSEVSREVMAILRAHAEHIEEASVDEAYLDLSFAGSYDSARDIALDIKKEIYGREHLTASVGIGPNKLIAKIASDIKKPDGLTVVEEADAEKFLEPMAIRKIPGVGPKTEERLGAMGIRTVGDARRFSADALRDQLGKFGAELYERSRGRSDSPIVEVWEAKSIGEQETFERDTRDAKLLRARLDALADGVFERFKKSGHQGFRGVTVTVRFADFTTKTRSVTLDAPRSAISDLQFAVLCLFMPFLDQRENSNRKAFRLLGVRVEKLT